MTEGIHLRPYKPSDVDPLCEAVLESKAELLPWMPWCHADYGRADAANWVETRPEAWSLGLEWSFVIAGAGDRLLGACGIHRIDKPNGVGEAGYWVRSSATGRGVATEALRQLAAWAFTAGKLDRLEIVASVENAGSRRVAEKAGATLEGNLSSRVLLNGRRHDAVLLALLPG